MVYNNKNQYWSSSSSELRSLLECLNICAVILSVNGIYYVRIFDPTKNLKAKSLSNVKVFCKEDFDSKMEELRAIQWEKGESFCKNNVK